MNLNLNDKVIIVSGGAKGIGKGIVQVLASEGAIPVIIGRNLLDAERVVKEIVDKGFRAFSVEAELTLPEAPKNVVKVIIEEYGRIDGLVNNAGVNDGVSLEDGNYAKFIHSLHKNLIHYYLLAQESLPYLKLSKGAIVNISSKTAETGQGGTSAYAASNGGRNALTREWAVELLKYNIRVNAVIVAECFTPMYENWINTLEDPKEMLEQIKANIPFGNRMTTTEEIADMVAFLISDRSSHTTGQLIHVDGGYTHLDRAIK